MVSTSARDLATRLWIRQHIRTSTIRKGARCHNPCVSGTSILHAATSPEGGAGIAAQRIRDAQVRCGLDAEIVFRGSHRTHPGDGAPTISISGAQSIRSRVVTLTNLLLTQRPSVLFTPRSANILARQLGQLARGFTLHLHNTFNMVDLRHLEHVSGPAQIFLTLHDERPLTAGCHSSLGCNGATELCRRCPQSRLPLFFPSSGSLAKQRTSMMEAAVRLVAPSKWIFDQAVRFGWPVSRLHLIPNPIDTDLFSSKWSRGMSPSSAFHSEDSFTIAWLPGKAERSFWEGYREFCSWLCARDPNVRPRVLTTTIAEVPDGVSVVRVPPPATEKERANFWSLADLAVSVTEADNFPNIVLESIAVGTPICVSNVGGSSEAVTATAGGYLVKNHNPGMVAQAIKSAFDDRSRWPEMMVKARETASSLYSYQAIGQLYAEAYQAASPSEAANRDD